MGIEIIPNQPISFESGLSESCDDFKANSCYYAVIGETAYIQFRQTPCGDNLVEDGNFHAPYTPWVASSGMVFSPDSTGDNFDDGKFCHIPGTIDTLAQTLDPLISATNYMKLTFTITGLTAGSIGVTYMGYSLGTITENGIFSLYGTFVPDVNNDLEFTFDSDSDGCISYVSQYRLLDENDIQIELYRNGVLSIVQPSWDFTLNNDFITVSWAWPSVSKGCYTIKVSDPCTDVYGSNVVPDPDIAAPLTWTHTNESGDDITLQNVTIATGYVALTVDIPSRVIAESYKQSISGLSNGKYRLTFTTGHIDSELQHGGGNVVNIFLGSNGFPISMGSLAPNSTYSFIINAVSLTGINDHVKIELNRVNEGFCTGGEYIEITSVRYQPVTSYAYESNCINVFSVGDGTKLVEARCETGGENLGFYWNGTFKLLQRLWFTKYAPSYPTDGSDYIFSSGRRELTYAQRQKFYDVLVEDVSEVEHDTLSTQILCDSFKVDTVEYFVEPSDYKPEWDKKKAYPLAEVRMLMMKQGTVIFNEKS